MTEQWATQLEFDSKQEWRRNFFLSHNIQTASGVNPASYPKGTRGYFPGGKAVWGEADHSPPSSTKVKNV
jgi:hypothetical protein